MFAIIVEACDYHMDVPKAHGDYRGNNITPVIAWAFEKIVYHCYARKTIESHLSTSQFAY